MSALLEEQDSDFERVKVDMQTKIIQAALRELGDSSESIGVPLIEDLLEATLDKPLD